MSNEYQTVISADGNTRNYLWDVIAEGLGGRWSKIGEVTGGDVKSAKAKWTDRGYNPAGKWGVRLKRQIHAA